MAKNVTTLHATKQAAKVVPAARNSRAFRQK